MMAHSYTLNDSNLTVVEGCLNMMATMISDVSHETDPPIDTTMTFVDKIVPNILVMTALKRMETTSDSAEKKMSVAADPTVNSPLVSPDGPTVLTVTLKLQKHVIGEPGEDMLTKRLT